MRRARPLGADLHAAWNRKLYQWWHHYNEEYLANVLQPPVIELSHASETLGHWDPQLRRIRISTDHISSAPWGAVMDTLRHEMAHQYAYEVLAAPDEAPHGTAFARACEKLRCVPGSGEQGTAAADEDPREARIARLMQKVLCLVDSPNEHEAQVAVSKARHLLLEYNLDLVALDRARSFQCRSLGPVKGRRSSWELWLAMILNGCFFVEVLWARTYEAATDREGTVLRIYGTRANLDMAQYVYEYLTGLLPRLWTSYRDRQGLRANAERMRYFAGVLEGFHSKLLEEEDRANSTEGALVWLGDQHLMDYFRYLNPRTQTRSVAGVRVSTAFRDGVEEGKQVTIRRPLEAGRDRFGGLLSAG